MKKIPGFILAMAVSLSAIAQTQSFDIVKFTPPTQWTKDEKQGVLSFVTVNQTAGSFCLVAIYQSKASSGDADTDFKAEWNDLVVTPFNATVDPKTEKQQTDDGWQVINGVAPVKIDGTDLYILLTVFSGFGKKLSIRSSLNDQSYTTQLDEMFTSFRLDKSKTPATQPVSTITSSTGTKFGAMNYSPLPGWSHQVYSDGIVFKPLDLAADIQLSIQIMSPITYSGSLEQALSTSYNEAAAMYGMSKMHYAGGAEYEKTTPKVSFQGWEYIQGNGGVQILNSSGYSTEFGLDLFVIKINNRFERIAILKSRKNCGSSRYYPTERRDYQNAINDFLFNLRFDDGPQPLLRKGTYEGSG